MTAVDVIVVGGGISGISFAWRAAQCGRRALLLEKNERVGGCLNSHRRADGFWYELGAHTTYNSYSNFLDVVVGTGLATDLIPRGPARKKFGLLKGAEFAWLTPPKVLLQLNWIEAAKHLPLGLFGKKRGKSVSYFYSRLLGASNFEKVLSPFFAAVPSQSADDFPVTGPGSLFKKRTRRKEYPRSFGVSGGLQTVCDVAAKGAGIESRVGVEVTRVALGEEGVLVSTSRGEEIRAPFLVLATPVEVTARLLQEPREDLAAALKEISVTRVESRGVILPREKCWIPECAFLVAEEDLFFSMVTRDPFPHPQKRAFCFHFRESVSERDMRRRITEVLRISEEDLGEVMQSSTTLPAPTVYHAQTIDRIDQMLQNDSIAITGNYFGGLAIEDCVTRSFAEWERISRR